MTTIFMDYGAPPFRFTGPWECALDGGQVRPELPLAGFFDDESDEWHLVCDRCAGSDTSAIRRRLDNYVESLGPDDGRIPWLRRLALHEWRLRTAGFDPREMWLICSNGHWFPRPVAPDEAVRARFADSTTGQGAEKILQLAKCPQCSLWVGVAGW